MDGASEETVLSCAHDSRKLNRIPEERIKESSVDLRLKGGD
jgi:hypothetical protein